MFQQKKIWTDQSIFGRCRAQKVQVTGQKGDLQYLTSGAQVGQRSKMLLIRKGCRISTNAFQTKSPNHNSENEVIFRIKKYLDRLVHFRPSYNKKCTAHAASRRPKKSRKSKIFQKKSQKSISPEMSKMASEGPEWPLVLNSKIIIYLYFLFLKSFLR